MRVSTEGGLKYLRPKFWEAERTLIDFARNFIPLGATVWDIGANVGLFSCVASHFAGPSGRVVAIEPDTWLIELLRSTVAANALDASLEIVPVAVGRRIELSRLTLGGDNRATNYLEGYPARAVQTVRGSQYVPVMTMDFLLGALPPPDIVKVDIEGAELAALQSAPGVLKTAPVLFLEVGQDVQRPVTQLLRGAGYRFIDPHTDAKISEAAYLTIAVPELS